MFGLSLNFGLSERLSKRLIQKVKCQLLCYVRMVYIQGENNKETEAWFSALSKAMKVGLPSF